MCKEAKVSNQLQYLKKLWGKFFLTFKFVTFMCFNFYVFLGLSSQLSVFLKLCIMNTLLYFLSCQLCVSLRNVSLGDPHIPSRSEYDDVIIEAPFQHCLGSPQP